MSNIRRKRSEPTTSDKLHVRSTSIEQRGNLTRSVIEKGGNGDTIAEITNTTYRILWRGRPANDRSDWDTKYLKEIAVTEHLQANKVRELPDQSTHGEIVDKATEGATVAREYLTDKTFNGNPYDHLFAGMTVEDPILIVGTGFGDETDLTTQNPNHTFSTVEAVPAASNTQTKARSRAEYPDYEDGRFSKELFYSGCFLVGLLAFYMLHRLIVIK